MVNYVYMPRKKAKKAPDFFIPAVMITGIFIAGLTVRAQSEEDFTNESTGSGATSVQSTSLDIQQQIAELEWKARRERSEAFQAALAANAKTAQQLQALKEENYQKRAEHRATCRADMRKANTYTILSTALRCYRAELTLELERLRKERDYIETMPGVTDDIRWLALTRNDLLLDAMNIIVTAIDSDVYQNVDELEEVKQNLLTHYRKPKWLMDVRLNADRLSAWTATLLTHIATIAEEPDMTEDALVQLQNGLLCLHEQEQLLQLVQGAQDVGEAQTLFDNAQSHMKTCLGTLRLVAGAKSAAGTEPAETEEDTAIESKETSSSSETPEYVNRGLRRVLKLLEEK